MRRNIAARLGALFRAAGHARGRNGPHMTVSRRGFLYSVANGTAAIGGWVLLPEAVCLAAAPRRAEDVFRPALRRQVLFRRTADGGELLLAGEGDAAKVVGHVNEQGARVVERLDGAHTLPVLAQALYAGADPRQLEHTTASVAAFLALLAQAGLLSAPFFLNLEAAEFTA